MILAIFLTRRSHLKILSPVIDASLKRGHETRLIADVRAAKKGDRLDVKELRRLWPTMRVEASVPHWADAVIAPDVVMPPFRGRRVSVAGWYDDLWLRPPATDGRVQCYISEYQMAQHSELWGGVGLSGHVVGWLPGDQAWRLPSRRRDSAVLFSLKMGVEPWRDSWEGRKFYRSIVREARDRAHAEGLRFVVKTRAKNKDPLWLRWYADELVSDTDMVPATSLSLLARAKWAVHFESGAVWEAVVMGAYSIAIAVPQPHIIDLPGSRLQYGGVPMHDWPGVSQYGFPKGVTFLSQTERAKYLEKFLGPCDGLVGERVLDVAEGK